MQGTPEAKGVLRLFIRCMSLEMKTLAQHVPKNLSRFEKYLPGFRIMTVTREQQAYRDAVEKLNSTQSGFKALKEKKQSGKKLGDATVEGMRQWIRRIGYNVDDLNRLNVVHVAGTKGKGSTCAFVNSILREHQQSIGTPYKIGLYTSPHLVTVRERIQINSAPISEELFAKYLFEVWDALEASAMKEGLDPAHKPTYFRFLTLMAYHVFMREGVDAAVIEVGVGGENDSTNVITQPAVTGITTLGIDHVSALGGTIDKIAWHKAGIFKTGSPAFTIPQVPEAMEILHQRAEEKDVQLASVPIHPALQNVHLKVEEDFQRKNASLAVELASTLLKRLGVIIDADPGSFTDAFTAGLENVICRGRCETLVTNNQIWYLDGAHTEDSLRVSTSWFARTSEAQLADSSSIPRVLIFNQQSARDTEFLLRTVHQTMYEGQNQTFQYAVFCTNTTYSGNSYKSDLINRNVDPKELGDLSLQKHLGSVWKNLDPHTEVLTFASIEDVVQWTKCLPSEGNQASVFVTGSFHLVGGILAVLEGDSSI